MKVYNTPQELFWAGEFGKGYIERNKSKYLLASNLNFYSKILCSTGNINSCIEFGANIGMNLTALKLLLPDIKLFGIEINSEAANILRENIGVDNVLEGSILDFKSDIKYDLSLIKGVLIHINPEKLNLVYESLYHSSNKYILIAEYYNPSPVSIPYRGHSDKLFKRDFAGEFLGKYTDLSLKDYGFSYHKDKVFPQDDITWFLLEKK